MALRLVTFQVHAAYLIPCLPPPSPSTPPYHAATQFISPRCAARVIVLYNCLIERGNKSRWGWTSPACLPLSQVAYLLACLPAWLVGWLVGFMRRYNALTALSDSPARAEANTIRQIACPCMSNAMCSRVQPAGLAL